MPRYHPLITCTRPPKLGAQARRRESGGAAATAVVGKGNAAAAAHGAAAGAAERTSVAAGEEEAGAEAGKCSIPRSPGRPPRCPTRALNNSRRVLRSHGRDFNRPVRASQLLQGPNFLGKASPFHWDPNGEEKWKRASMPSRD